MRQASESAAEVPLVSVGVPVFNGEAFLEDAIRSVLAQTLDDLELILCDNASQDRTAEICSDYAARDPRVRYFRNPGNLGAAANYNLAFSHARARKSCSLKTTRVTAGGSVTENPASSSISRARSSASTAIFIAPPADAGSSLYR